MLFKTIFDNAFNTLKKIRLKIYICHVLFIYIEGRNNILNKNLLKVGIIFLFTISVLTPIVTGYNIENNQEESRYEVLHISDWVEKAKIIASDGSNGDWFGVSVDIYGNHCVIGARDDDNERGSAYVFKRVGDLWEQEQKLLAYDGVAGDWFGISVSIFEDFIFVGADAEDNENGLNAGSVYVFKQNGSSWIQHNKLVASDGTENDYFGRYVAIDEEYSIIGAYYDDEIAGSAYVFKRLGDEWIEEAKLTASDRLPGDYFGISTSIEDDYAIIGAYRDDNSNGVDAGSVYVFKRNGGSWEEETKLLASDGEAGDRFGISTDIDSNYLVIGSYFEDGNKGSIYIFNKTSTGWIEEEKLAEPGGVANNYFGRSVSIKKNIILVGAWGDGGASGSAYIFNKTSTGWIEEAKLTASDASGNDRFGYQVSIHERFAVIGAYSDDNENGVDAGAAYIFESINYAPSTPNITGTVNGNPGVEYTYTFNSVDPEGDNVYYYIIWDDGYVETWDGPHSSGQEVDISHTFANQGTYTIKAKARDIYGSESDWGELEVNIPRNKASSCLWFELLFERYRMLINFIL